jgi:hypothetical protein
MRCTGGALGSTMDHERRAHSTEWHLTSARHTSARAHRSTLAVAEGDEGDEAVPEAASLGTERGNGDGRER